MEQKQSSDVALLSIKKRNTAQNLKEVIRVSSNKGKESDYFVKLISKLNFFFKCNNISFYCPQ